MRIENKRVINRNKLNKTIVEDDKQGLYLTDSNLNVIEKLGYNEFRLLDFSQNGNIILLNSKEWLKKGNASKTTLTAFDISTKKQLFTSEKFLAYRSFIDSKSEYFLLEYYGGLCSLNLNNGEIIYKKDKIDKSLYNADLECKTNRVFIPTKKKSLITYDFYKQELNEIKFEKIGQTSWIKFNNSQSHLLVTDLNNCLHCFENNNFSNPIWTINFSEFEIDNEIWTYNIITTESNIGCIHGFTPDYNQTANSGGTLYIFNIENGDILDKYNYSNINEQIITDYQTDKILIDNLTSLSLTKKKIENTPITELLK